MDPLSGNEHDGSRRKSPTIVDHALSRKATFRSLRAERQAPPVPPIPAQTVEMSWQKRSMKRDSYTSSTFNLPPEQVSSPPQGRHTPDARDTFRPQSTFYPVLRKLRSREKRGPSSNASWDDHPANPQQWSCYLRWLHVVSALVTAFTITLASAINAPTLVTFQELGLSSTVSVLPHSLFLLGLSMAAGTGYLRSLFARKTALLGSMVPFITFILIAAFVRNSAAIIIARCLAGLAASTILPTLAAVLLDLFPAGRRTVVFVLFASAIFFGIVIGPLFCSIATENGTLQWTEYITLICAAPSILSMLVTRETSHATIASRCGVARTGCSRASASSYAARLLQLAQQKSVWASVSSIAVVAGITFSLVQSLPNVMLQVYSFDHSKQGTLLLALLCGCAVSICFLAAHHVLTYLPRRTQWEDNFVAEWDKFEKQKHRSQARRKTKSMQDMRKSRLLTVENKSLHDLQAPAPARTTQGLSPGFCMSPGLAVAIASEIDAKTSTTGAYVSAEQIWSVAVQRSTFADVLDELEVQYGVRLDRIKMIQLYESWSSNGARTSMILTTPLQMPHFLAEPTTTEPEDINHRAMALAALESGESVSASGSGSVKKSRRSLYTTAPLSHAQRPPPTWRMLPAFPGALAATAGLFILAWTMTQQWWVPALGLAIYGGGAFTVAVCVCLYLVDTFGAEDIAHSLTIVCSVSYMCAFVSSMVSVPLFDNLAPHWALCTLAFISLLVWAGPLCLRFTPVNDSYYENDGR